ncbi:MAG: hypothetical protein K2L82_13910 [Lachnospiraceae bacterium]|nr:hypothetical protein [Lachnospiraceae bacterium]
MTYRKTWFSCVVWLLYTILCIALLVYAGSVWAYYFAGVPYTEDFPGSIIAPLAGLSDAILSGIGLLIIPVTIGLYWVIRGSARQVRKKCTWKNSVITGFECISVLLIMAAGIVLRIDGAKYDILMAENGVLSYYGQAQGMQHYDMAVVTAGNSVSSFTILGLQELYVLCLSVVLSFLGNKIASAIIMQVFLQIIGMILVYAVTRKIAGRIPACTALLYLACSPCCIEMLACIGPEWLFFDLYMIGMLFAVGFVKSYCANRLRRPVTVVGAVVLGVIIGLLVYLHPVAITILIVIAAVVVGRKHCQDDKQIYHSAGISAVAVIVMLLASAVSWIGVTAAVYYEKGTDIPKIIEQCRRHLGFLQYDIVPSEKYPYYLDIYLVGVLVVFASFLIFEFLREGKEQNYTLWLLICILATPTPLSALGQSGGENFFGVFSLYVWSVLAGLGLQNCIFGGRAKVMQAVIEEINSTAELEKPEQAGEPEITEKPEQTDELGAIEKPEQTDEPEITDKPEEPRQINEPKDKIMEDETIEDKTEVSESTEKPRFFENPLPLPKKHVKREMDYQYQVDEKDMKYDIEISENDDFDI